MHLGFAFLIRSGAERRRLYAFVSILVCRRLSWLKIYVIQHRLYITSRPHIKCGGAEKQRRVVTMEALAPYKVSPKPDV